MPNGDSDPGMFEVVVTDRREEALDICTFELRRPGGHQLPPFSAGAHIDVQIRSGMVRQYSLCNPPGDHHRYLIGVLRGPNPRGASVALHDTVHVGHRALVSEPRNRFQLSASARRSLLLAGGIGITPILCMAEQLAQIGADFEMHYCTRSPARTAFLDRIRRSSFSDHIHHHFDSGPEDQRLRGDVLLADPSPDTHLYVCGPSGFIEHVLRTAKSAGWSSDCLHREYFLASGASLSSSDRPFDVRLARSGRVISVLPGHTIAQALAENGVYVPVSCEVGVCGTCLTRVLEGEPDHRDSFLTDAERARNDQMTLCCSGARGPLLVLDLF